MPQTSPEGPRGIGDWLAFRIVQLAILNPLWSIVLHAGATHPYLLFASALTVSFGFISAILLALELPIAIRMVAIHLTVWALYAAFLVGYDLRFIPLKRLGIGLTLTVIDAAMYVAWFLYFRRSLRVRNTFGRNL